MDTNFRIGKNTIPVELRSLYEEVSSDFEQRVFGALKTKMGRNDEKARKVSKKFSIERKIHAAVHGGKDTARA